MNYFSNNKLWPGIVLLLVLINTATLVFFWYINKKQPLLPPVENRGNAGEYLTRELSLNPAQQAAYTQLRQSHQQEMQALRQHIKEAKDSFYNLLDSPLVSDAILNRYALNTATTEQQLDVLNFHHFQQVRAICNGEQKKKI